jgi:predicted CoA-binding protein
MLEIYSNTTLRNILENVNVIAVVGLSPKINRPSNLVARYLLEVGYTVIPVNPGQDKILGLKCYASLDDVPVTVDLVDIFRRPEDIGPIVESAVRKGIKYIWMQLGIVNSEAAGVAREHGCEVVMDRCIKIDHQNLM